MSIMKPKHIIAIGASAGGLEELITFFNHTPLDGVAYVIVQHLSAEFKSRMVEVLSRHSKLMVTEAEEGMEVCANMVCLIPSNKYMTISNNHLHLTEKINQGGPHLTINTFMKSLASDYGNKAIGVILSGLGSDGTEGVKMIKNAGGMVIAREPTTTEFSSMPSSAIAAGVVDCILEPQAMPLTIEMYVENNAAELIHLEKDEKTILKIITLIKENLPLDFSDYKLTTILRRTKKRAASQDCDTLEQYFDFLKIKPEEVTALSKEFLISVSSFFRNPEAFEILKKEVIPKILDNLQPGEELKMWVAGCATGQEAYSLAIVICELLSEKNKNIIVRIFATDIDAEALHFAGKGKYQSKDLANVSSERLTNYFIADDDYYTTTPEIRKMVIFAPHDVVKNAPYCNMHLISCRNLLIYMTPTLQKKIFGMLLFGLKTDGYLFLGSSENPMPIIDKLEIVDKKWRIYKCLKDKKVVNFEVFTLPDIQDVKQTSLSQKRHQEIDSRILAKSMSEILVEEMDFLAVCVDKDNNVIESIGDTTKYLIQQNFNSNLLALLPKSLAVAFNTISRQALVQEKKVGVKGIQVQQDGKTVSVNLSVTPVLFDNGQKRGLVAIFNDSLTAQGVQEGYPLFEESDYNDTYTKNLEKELRESKSNLVSAYEKLDATNENMQSYNEELISANEEMQSTNEEMQSVNEELHTINADYQAKNKELLELNDDLNNYFRSNVNGQLFINNELQLMKYSPGAVKLINLRETDIGRPLSNISTNIKLDSIEADVREVLKSGDVITKEIETNSHQWYQIMIMPYIQSGNKKNGAIITFNEVTELKKIQLDLDEKNKSLSRINADLDHFIFAASHDLLAPLGNIETSIAMVNQMDVEDTEVVDFLNIMDTSIKKFRALITDIALIAKVESEMMMTEEIDLAEVIDNVEWSLRDKINNSATLIEKDLKINHIVFSKKNMRSIIFNLISNAIKFKSEKSPHIIIRTHKDNNFSVLAIEDNGRGIASSGLEKIFNLYGRLNQNVEGSGIGLYLTKKIINAAGGHIEVESELGIGTKFSIFIKNESAPPHN